MMNYIKAIRPINLFIIAVVQAYLIFYLIRPVLALDGYMPRLSLISSLLFIVTTLLITAGGNIINDYFDLENDKLNGEEKSISDLNSLKLFYNVLRITGFGLAIYIASTIQSMPLVLIYPLAVIVLYYYSKTLKKRGLIGNLVVALFTAMVPAILLIAEPQLLNSNNPNCQKATLIILIFSIFAFMINFIREIVKDIEDVDGDKTINNKSLPISIGIDRTKIFVYFHTVFMLILIMVWTFIAIAYNDFRSIIFNMIFIIAPLTLSILKLSKAKEKIDYHKVATLYKWIMLAGMISLILLINNIIK